MSLLGYVRYNLSVIFLVIGFIETSKSSLPDCFSCFQKGTCDCVGNNGEVIDLSPLANLNLPLIAATNKNLYMFHPCSDVSLNSIQNNECRKSFGLCHFVPQNVTDKILDYHKVLQNIILGTFTKLSTNNEAVFRVNSKKQLEIVYKHTIDAGITTTTYVILNCDENLDTYTLVSDKTTPQEHVLTLSSRYSCIKTEHHLSRGAIFFIILVVLFATYFISGILVLKFIRGATGIEMIPNHEFWCKLPQLAKDGIVYLRNCGKTAPDSYEKI